MFNPLSAGIGAVGGMVNGGLDAAVQAQGQMAQAQASMQQMENTQEQLKKMKRESQVSITNGYVETVSKVRI